MILFKMNLVVIAFKLINIMFFITFIQSCANTQIGQDISNSFDAPEVESSNSLIPKKSSKDIKKDSNTNALNRKPRETIIYKNKVEKKIKSIIKTVPFNPQPYRITIKLSAANPSAPAETLTSALRAAGVIFEVEKIELIKNSSRKNSRAERNNR